jgi:hypothetical protein
VGITPERLVELYPRVYHMAEDGTWGSIRRRGLLSTSALLDLYGMNGTERFAIESQQRPQPIRMEHAVYGPAVVRDQKVLRENPLRDCLIGMTPQDWYELLNGKVFFWLTKERLIGLLGGREYRNRAHCVLTIDTARLLATHLNRIKLSPINSGSTIYRAQPRGRETFASLEDYPFEARRRMRGIPNAIAELCVEHSVPNIGELVTRVSRMEGPRETGVIYERVEQSASPGQIN